MSQPPPPSGPPAPDAGARAADGAGPAGRSGDPSARQRPAPGTDLGTDLSASLGFAGNALLRSPLAFLGAGALYMVVMIVVVLGAFVAALLFAIAVVESGPAPGDELTAGQFLLTIAVSVGVVVVSMPVALLWQAGAARAGGVILEGGRPTFGQALVGPGRVFLTALLVMVIVVIGTFLLYLPGIIAGVFLMYAIPAAVRGASPVAALKESVALARAHLGTTVVGYLALMVASYAGSMVVIGMIAAIPFGVLLQLALYERLNGRELPEPAKV